MISRGEKQIANLFAPIGLERRERLNHGLHVEVRSQEPVRRAATRFDFSQFGDGAF